MKILLRLALLALVITSFQSCALLSAAGISSQGQPTKEVNGDLGALPTTSAVVVDHSAWDSLLKRHVDNNGDVNYKGFTEDKSKLQSYVRMLSKTIPTNNWSVQELLAYYINLYNAHTVLLIIDNYPVNSIKDINGPWTRGIVPIGDKNLSLGGIENGILRKMNEPRIHFAINCASISCPKLLNEAYTGLDIDKQLDRVTRDFINGSKNDISINKLELSSIFDWYKNDYTINGEQDVIGFINQYYLPKIKINPNAAITYKEYNWNLNEQK